VMRQRVVAEVGARRVPEGLLVVHR
jgi:hypothetical protein